MAPGRCDPFIPRALSARSQRTASRRGARRWPATGRGGGPGSVLGKWDESGPHRQSFLGHLYALRVLFLHRHNEHPEWPERWAEALWQRGLATDLISPLAANGMRAWRLSGDLLAWSALVGEGVREGWLPW